MPRSNRLKLSLAGTAAVALASLFWPQDMLHPMVYLHLLTLAVKLFGRCARLLQEQTSSRKDSLQSAKVESNVVLPSGKRAMTLMACEQLSDGGDRQAAVCCNMKYNDR